MQPSIMLFIAHSVHPQLRSRLSGNIPRKDFNLSIAQIGRKKDNCIRSMDFGEASRKGGASPEPPDTPAC